jgi:hypothetical protein
MIAGSTDAVIVSRQKEAVEVLRVAPAELDAGS